MGGQIFVTEWCNAIKGELHRKPKSSIFFIRFIYLFIYLFIFWFCFVFVLFLCVCMCVCYLKIIDTFIEK